MQARFDSRSKVKKACNQCSFRKIKCDGLLPCMNCVSKKFACSFSKAKTRKDPQGKRIAILQSSNQYSKLNHVNDGSGTADFPVSNTSDDTSLGLHDQEDNFQLTGAHNAQTPVLVARSKRNPRYHTVKSHSRPSNKPDLAGLGGTLAIPNSCFSCLGKVLWPETITDSCLVQWVDLFFDRLYNIIPVLNRQKVFKDIIEKRHKTDQHFAAMILSLSALSLIQPVYPEERISLPEKANHADFLLRTACRIRASPYLGDNVTIEATLTSYLMFSCMFGLSKQNAAWFHLREAIDLASILELDKAQSYQHISRSEGDIRIRLFLLLCITERGYAIQRSRTIFFKGSPLQILQQIYPLLQQDDLEESAETRTDDRKHELALLGLLQLMKLHSVTNEEIVECWNGGCSRGTWECSRFDVDHVLMLHRMVQNVTSGLEDTTTLETILWQKALRWKQTFSSPTRVRSSFLHPTQWADVYVLQQWIHNRLWTLCLSHKLLSENSDHSFLRLSFAVEIAIATLQECQKMDRSALEVHGFGMIERLYDIASSVVLILDPATHSIDSLSHEQFERISNLVENYLELLDELRGGDHPYTRRLRQQYNIAIGV